MKENVCCICAHRLSSQSCPPECESEKPSFTTFRTLHCCSRAICYECVQNNPRFENYCPYCQTSSETSTFSRALHQSPTFAEKSEEVTTASGKQFATYLVDEDEPPEYQSLYHDQTGQGVPDPKVDVEHYLRPNDSIASISLAYSVPLHILRSHNRLHADHLLAARRKISIPFSHYRGPSLSGQPVDNPEESQRKTRIRKFMVATKCHEYNVAELYLKQAGGDLGEATHQWRNDERWEMSHPFHKGEEKSKSKKGGFWAGVLK